VIPGVILARKQSILVLSGVRNEVRDAVKWTKIDRFFSVHFREAQGGVCQDLGVTGNIEMRNFVHP
jgi:hypothetical protein